MSIVFYYFPRYSCKVSQELLFLDFDFEPKSVLVDGLSTKVLDANHKQIKVVAWYDNEYGYTAQMLRVMDKLLKL